MNTLDQLKTLIDETEFSDRVRDKVKELVVKAKLRNESGVKEEDCLTQEEIKELTTLIRADMILDGLRAKACQAYLAEIDKIITDLIK